MLNIDNGLQDQMKEHQTVTRNIKNWVESGKYEHFNIKQTA